MSIGSGVFDPRGSKNRGVPLTRLVALTTVMHYHADCDSNLAPILHRKVKDGQGTKQHRNIAENFNRLNRAQNVTDDKQTTDRQTDRRRHIANELTFANKKVNRR